MCWWGVAPGHVGAGVGGGRRMSGWGVRGDYVVRVLDV